MSFLKCIFVPENGNFSRGNIPIMVKKLDRTIFVIINLFNLEAQVGMNKREVAYKTGIGKNRLNKLSGRNIFGHYMISEHVI